jgi:LuxR family maltose regulon positive regulatory protein
VGLFIKPQQNKGDDTMESTFEANHDSTASFHFERPRLNGLFMEAVKYPLVVVCAGAGYGKTTAVEDFLKGYKAAVARVRLSDSDNVGVRFWENYTHSVSVVNPTMAKELFKFGFPDTIPKIQRYKKIIDEYIVREKRILVIDDFHCIEDPAVLQFMEGGFFRDMLQDTTIFLISRSLSRVNIAGKLYRDQAFNISEDDLCFTENELAQYFRRLGISSQPDGLREIMKDTEGWAFAINLIARSYQKAPGYGGYVRNAMKRNISNLLETEIWAGISERLQNFLVRLSLIDHLSDDLIKKLADNDDELISGMKKQSAYIRLDSYINAYLIHPLFLDFLKKKQDLISKKQKDETYKTAGNWCRENGFRIDALSYYEKIRDYQSIIDMFFELPLQVPLDFSRYAAEILDNAPLKKVYEVEFFAEMHLRTYMMSQDSLEKSLKLMKDYEVKFLELPDNNNIKKRTLAWLNISGCFIRGLMSLKDDIYDADTYLKKAGEYVSTSVDPGTISPHCPAVWIICVGSSREGALEEYIDAITRSENYLSQSNLRGFMAGKTELTRGVLEFYRGSMGPAESFVTLALKKARENKQFGIVHRALFYSLRIAAAQGNFAQAEQALKETKAQTAEKKYLNRFMDYDISLSWYYCFLDLPEKTSEWLQEDFSAYIHAGYIENFWNFIKARFCYATRNFTSLLAHIEAMKKRESFLLERIELLAMEACVYYKMKDRKKAFAALRDAYENAQSNNIVMPFIEMGKDMRILASAFQKEGGGAIPQSWLEDINRKSASYAKRKAHVISEYIQANRITDNPAITPRETDILGDLSHGLSRTEIASSRNLSINTVKMVINSLYFKLGAENLADLVRIATKRKMT